jgi:signal transduction histidine kinase
MFTRLRNRVLILNMALTTLILAISFVTVYLVISNNTHAENEYRLRELAGGVSTVAIVAVDEADTTMETEVPVATNLQNVLSIDGSAYPSFVIEMDAAGAILQVVTNALPDDGLDDLYQQAGAYAWQHQESGKVELAGRQWLYEVTLADILAISTPTDGQDSSVAASGTAGATTDDRTGDAESDATDRQGRQDEFSVAASNSAPYRYVARFLDVTDSLVTLRRLLMAFLLVGLAAFGAIFLASWFFANRSIRPLKQAWEQQQRFIADASHELKTPLTIITTNSDALLANEQHTIASQREWLDYLRIGTDRMHTLINGLLTYAQIEEAGFMPTLELVNLSETTLRVLGAFRAAAAEKSLVVTVDVEPELTRSLDRKLVEEIVFALIENAVKYADVGGFVEVDLHAETQKSNARQALVLTVTNSGAGIAAEDLPHIFERFYRADRARGGEHGSYGLGLSIVKAALERLGGTIEVASTPQVSTTFTITL